MIEYLSFEAPFPLESGESIQGLTIAYSTYGRLNNRGDNVVWVCHALTANSEVHDWWPHTVVEGGFLDPERYFVVCANILGSHYGTTGPLSLNPATGEPYYDDFPQLTIRDMVRAHEWLADRLGIGRVYALVGCSVGGFQAVEWGVRDPERFDRLVLCATDAKATPWSIAIDESQRMAIRADKTYGERREDAGMAGMAAARSLGLLTYRGPEGYNRTQQDPPGYSGDEPHRAVTYQRYQGEKLCRRFNAYSYMRILDAFDTHDVGYRRGGVAEALGRLGMPTMVIGITTDIIFRPEEMRVLASRIPNGEYREITSPYGHDGFLIEHGQLNGILREFFEVRN